MFSKIQTSLIDVSYNYVVIGGDFNSDVRENNKVSLVINDWMATLNLTLANKLLHIPCTIRYTFAAKSRNAYSYIDHFYVSSNPANLAHSIKDIDSCENFSDHDPIVLTLDKDIYNLCKQNISENSRSTNLKEKSYIYENVFLD